MLSTFALFAPGPVLAALTTGRGFALTSGLILALTFFAARPVLTAAVAGAAAAALAPHALHSGLHGLHRHFCEFFCGDDFILFGHGNFFLGLAALEYMHRGLAIFGTAAGHGGDFVSVVALDDRLAVAVEFDLDGAAQYIHLRYGAETGRGLYKGPVLGYCLYKRLIGLFLIPQAAHKPAAGARDLGRVERERLSLGHLGADGVEIGQKLAAAERAAADADAAEHLGLVAHADLPELDAAAEHSCEILDQLTEVNAAVAGEVEGYLVAFKAALYVYQLHVQLVFGDFFAENAQSLMLTAAVYLLHTPVAIRGYAHHWTDGRDDFIIGNIVVAGDALRIFKALTGLDYHVFAGFNGQAVGVKVIGLAAALELYADYLGHIVVFVQNNSSFLYAVYGYKAHDGLYAHVLPQAV